MTNDVKAFFCSFPLLHAEEWGRHSDNAVIIWEKGISKFVPPKRQIKVLVQCFGGEADFVGFMIYVFVL